MQHLVATKRFLAGMVHAYGVKAVLPDFDGTVEEAIKAIQDDPREVFSPCDHVDDKGYCLGHTKETK